MIDTTDITNKEIATSSFEQSFSELRNVLEVMRLNEKSITNKCLSFKYLATLQNGNSNPFVDHAKTVDKLKKDREIFITSLTECLNKLSNNNAVPLCGYLVKNAVAVTSLITCMPIDSIEVNIHKILCDYKKSKLNNLVALFSTLLTLGFTIEFNEAESLATQTNCSHMLSKLIMSKNKEMSTAILSLLAILYKLNPTFNKDACYDYSYDCERVCQIGLNELFHMWNYFISGSILSKYIDVSALTSFCLMIGNMNDMSFICLPLTCTARVSEFYLSKLYEETGVYVIINNDNNFMCVDTSKLIYSKQYLYRALDKFIETNYRLYNAIIVNDNVTEILTFEPCGKLNLLMLKFAIENIEYKDWSVDSLKSAYTVCKEESIRGGHSWSYSQYLQEFILELLKARFIKLTDICKTSLSSENKEIYENELSECKKQLAHTFDSIVVSTSVNYIPRRFFYLPEIDGIFDSIAFNKNDSLNWNDFNETEKTLLLYDIRTYILFKEHRVNNEEEFLKRVNKELSTSTVNMLLATNE